MERKCEMIREEKRISIVGPRRDIDRRRDYMEGMWNVG